MQAAQCEIKKDNITGDNRVCHSAKGALSEMKCIIHSCPTLLQQLACSSVT